LGSAAGAAVGYGSANLLIAVWDNIEHFLKVERGFDSHLRMAGTYGSIGLGFLGVGSSAGFMGGYKYAHAQVLLNRNIAKNFPGFDAGTETIIEFADKFFELDPLAKEKIRKTIAELRVKDLYDQANGVSPKKFDVREILFSSRAVPREQIESVERLLAAIQAKSLDEQLKKASVDGEDAEKIKTPWVDLNNKTLKGIEDWSRMLKIGLDMQIGRYKRSLENESEFSDEEIETKVEDKFGLLTRALDELKELLAARRIL
jgi:hypothetical protein